jgi:hypothetical protein
MNLTIPYLELLADLLKYNEEKAKKYFKSFLDEMNKLHSEDRMECLLNVIDIASEFPRDSKDRIVKLFRTELKALKIANRNVGKTKEYSDDKVLSEACELFHDNYKEPKIRIIK